MYDVIGKHQPVIDKYAGELQSQGVCDDAWIKGEKQKYEDASMASFDMAQPGQ